MTLELDRQPRAHDEGSRQRVASSVANPQDWYPKKNTDYRWLGEGIKRVLTAAAVLACVVLGWMWLNGRTLPGPLARLLDHVEFGSNGVVVVDDVGATEGIDCYTHADGEYLVFTDAKGTENVVESPAQVPAKYRASVRCVRLKH